MWRRLKFPGKLEHAGPVSVTTCLRSAVDLLICQRSPPRKLKSWLPCLHPHASPSLALPVRQGYQDCCVREEIRVANCCEITGFFRSEFARRCCTSSSAYLLSSYEASAEEVVACFSTENQNSAQHCLLGTCLFHAQEERAMCAARYNTCAYYFKIGDRSAVCEVTHGGD
jgi:hypothetical protein